MRRERGVPRDDGGERSAEGTEGKRREGGE